MRYNSSLFVADLTEVTVDRRSFLATLGLSAWRLEYAAAQSVPKPARIGWLTAQREASLTPYVKAMRESLAELGYVEGKNLTIEFRYGDDAIERVPELASDLERLPVDLIVAQGAAVEVIGKIKLKTPIVYIFSGDPVSAGFAESLARPHGNMTGLTFMAAEFNGKRLELLLEFIPGLRRVAIIANPEHPGEEIERRYSEEAGQRSGSRPIILRPETAVNSTAPSPGFRKHPFRQFLFLLTVSQFRTDKRLLNSRWAAGCP